MENTPGEVKGKPINFFELNRFAERVLDKPLWSEEHLSQQETGVVPVLNETNSTEIGTFQIKKDATGKVAGLLFESKED